MSKLLLSAMVVLAFSTVLRAQTEIQEPIRWMMGGGLGGTVALGKNTSGHPTDPLTKFPGTGGNVEPVNVSYFFHRGSWGINTSIFINTNDQNVNSLDQFETSVRQTYGGSYTVTINGFGDVTDRVYSSFLIGPAFKIEHGRIILVGKLLGGFTEFNVDHYSVDLKEIGGNERKSIVWKPEGKSYGHSINAGTASPAILIGYRFNKRLMGALDLGYVYGRTKFRYEETTIESSGEQVTHYYPYSVTISNMTAGVKLLITF